MFTHHKLRQQNEPLTLSYETLREAVLELYLSVKIRSDVEIEAYNESQFKREKTQMNEFCGFELIDLVKECIEKLMTLHDHQQQQNYCV